MAVQNKFIAVVGAGTIGSSVALDLALHGFKVRLKDVDEESLNASREEIKKGYRLSKLLSKSKAQPSYNSVLDHLQFTSTYDGFEDVNFVIENINENFSAKRSVYAELSKVCAPETVYAANTSCISITRLGGCIPTPQNMIGMHFMNPVPVSRLVEVVRGAHTSDETVAQAKELAAELQKTCVVVNDIPGFVTNRIMMPMINEAVWAVHDQVAEPAQVDTILKLGFGHKMGPLATADLIGLDTILDSLNILHESFNDPKYRPCPLLKEMVDAGILGKKAGKGFFDY